MAVKLNKDGEAHLGSLIDAGKYNTDKGWDFTAEDGNTLLGDKGEDWTRFSSVHLGEDDSASENTKARWKYPAAKAKEDSEEVYRAGLIAAKDRAAQEGESDIEAAASRLLERLDAKDGKKPEAAKPEENAAVAPSGRPKALRDMPRIMTRIFGAPLLVDRAKMDVILSVLGPRLGLVEGTTLSFSSAALAGGWDGDDDDGSDAGAPYAVTDEGLAVLSIEGSLVYKSSWLGALSGLTGYGDLRAALDQAVADPAVKGILLSVDSFGGEANGCFDLSDAIYAARGTKPIYGVAADDACSAAYALLSATEKVFVSRTSRVGSIGVVALHVDQSAADKMDGLKYQYVYAGAHKIDGNPHAPLTEQALAGMQAQCDSLRQLFASSVAKYRGMPVEKVLGTEAASYFGDGAVAAGLADAVGTPGDALAALAQRVGASANTPAPAPAAQPAAMAGNGQVVNLDDIRQAARGEAATTYAEIADLCRLAGMPERAAEFISSGKSVAAVREQLISARAEVSDARAPQGHLMPDADTNNARAAAAGWEKAITEVCGGLKETRI